MSLKKLWTIFLNPSSKEKHCLETARARVPEKYQGKRQMYGFNSTGCGATIGTMPRCDFNCTGCYLGKDANLTPRQPIDKIKSQLRHLRGILGFAGNVQLTDGEVTLLPEDELIELIRYSREIDLVPMVMSHGDSYRRRPTLLRKLVEEGGLIETSIHVDTTQKGRTGAAYKNAKTEKELNPLRNEFATLIRQVRKETNKPIVAAMTATITGSNMEGVSDIMRWFVHNTDAVKLISFQPMAQVGRTQEGLGGLASVETLWEKIAEGVYGDKSKAEFLERGRMWFGHPDCSRLVTGLCITQPGEKPFFHPICLYGDPMDEKVVLSFINLFPAISFRTDTPLQRAVRTFGMLKNPAFFKLVTLNIFPYIMHWARRANAKHPYRFLWHLITGKAKMHKTLIASHHFMSDDEVKTPEGKERLDMCVFHVSVNGDKVPMCETNATDVRDDYYDNLRPDKKEPQKKTEPALH